MNELVPYSKAIWQLPETQETIKRVVGGYDYTVPLKTLQAPAAMEMARTAIPLMSNPFGIAALLTGATIGGEAYQNYKRDKAIAEQNNFSRDMRNIRNTQAQFVPEGNNKPANNISQPADVIRKRQMWSKPQQRPTRQPIPQMWSQGGAERGYSRNFAEADAPENKLMEIALQPAEGGNPYAQAAAMGNMDQAMAVPDPTDYNARFYEICRQYGLM